LSKYILGVDGGGTKTDAAIADASGKIIATASNGGANWERMGIAKALDSLEEVINKCAADAGIKTAQIASATFAIAGIDWPTDVKLYLPIATRLQIENYQFVNDSFAALYAGSPTLEGIVSIAGTGGKTAGIFRGKQVQSMGMELGEGGGAGQLVGLALEYIAMQFHDTAEASALYEEIPAAMGKEAGIDFFESVARNGLKLNESLAPKIFELADKQDLGALYAVKKTALQHAKDVCGIAKQLGISDEEVTVVRAGGLHTAGNKAFDLEFENHLRDILPNVKSVVLKEAPVIGAVKSAAGALNA
jgi:N-acetylglucosamine kinase-like BadF-type ATPase